MLDTRYSLAFASGMGDTSIVTEQENAYTLGWGAGVDVLIARATDDSTSARADVPISEPDTPRGRPNRMNSEESRRPRCASSHFRYADQRPPPRRTTDER
ncbi:MAG: hypothetical protein M3O36_17145 [Myxococcota bacterium]|nr:hypothetical protein [Myxococcota bacterium]